MSIEELLRPYKQLPPFLQGDPINLMAAAMNRINAEAEWQQRLDSRWDVAYAYGLGKGAEKANELAQENYNAGINRGYTTAFEQVIAGPNYAILHTGDDRLRAVGADTLDELIEKDVEVYDVFAPDIWAGNPKAPNKATSLVGRDTVWAEYEDLLYLDIGKLRDRTQSTDPSIRGRVMAQIPELNDNGTPKANGGGWYTKSAVTDFKGIMNRLKVGNMAKRDLVLDPGDVKTWSTDAFNDIMANAPNLLGYK